MEEEKQRIAVYYRSCHEKTKELIEFQTAGASGIFMCHPEWNTNQARVYGDFGADGCLNSTRPGLRQLIEDCKNGNVNVVIFKSISRLSKNTGEAIGIVHELQKMGVRVFFAKEGIDTDDPFSEMVLTIMKTIAEEDNMRKE